MVRKLISPSIISCSIFLFNEPPFVFIINIVSGERRRSALKPRIPNKSHDILIMSRNSVNRARYFFCVVIGVSVMT